MIEVELKLKICSCGAEFIPRYRNGLLISKLCPDCLFRDAREKRILANKQTILSNRSTLKSPNLPVVPTTLISRVVGNGKKKVRRISEKGLIAKLDKIFSLFIRQRDSKNGVFKCISCGKPKPCRLADNGHYINRANMTTRYDEVNCNAQCSFCNRFREGAAQGYRQGLIKKYGEQAVDMLEMKRHNTSHISSVELQVLIELYKEKLNQNEINRHI